MTIVKHFVESLHSCYFISLYCSTIYCNRSLCCQWYGLRRKWRAFYPWGVWYTVRCWNPNGVSQKIRKLQQKYGSRDQWKMEKDTQEEAQERNILLSVPILKLIDKKEIDVLTVENENNLSTSQPKKLYQWFVENLFIICCQEYRQRVKVCKSYQYCDG